MTESFSCRLLIYLSDTQRKFRKKPYVSLIFSGLQQCTRDPKIEDGPADSQRFGLAPLLLKTYTRTQRIFCYFQGKFQQF